MFFVHRLIKRMASDSGSRRRRRWSWILDPLYAVAVAAVVSVVAALIGVNVLYELTAAVERAQDVTLVVSAAALAAALVGISVALSHAPQVKTLDGERADEFALAALGPVLLAWVSTLVLLYQWLLAALSSSPEAIRLVPALGVELGDLAGKTRLSAVVRTWHYSCRFPPTAAPSIRPSRSALGLLHCADGLGLRGGRGGGVGGSGETGGSGVEHGAVDGLVELRDDPDAGVAVEDLDQRTLSPEVSFPVVPGLEVVLRCSRGVAYNLEGLKLGRRDAGVGIGELCTGVFGGIGHQHHRQCRHASHRSGDQQPFQRGEAQLVSGQ